MDSKCRINREVWSTNTAALVALAPRVLALFLLAAVLLIGGQSPAVSTGLASASPQETKPEQVAATIKANAQALKAFSYQQRTQLQLNGETKKVTLNQMNYDANGNLQKVQLSEEPPPGSSPPSGGRLKQRVIARKTGEFKDMMNDITALVTSYTELPQQQLQASLQRATFSQGQGDMAGAVQIQMNNVIQQGDSLVIWIDRTALLFRRATIATSYEQNPVTVTANYAMLPSGQVYMAKAILNYPKKQLVLEIDNLNYQKSQ
jgi:hypothetical protein